MSASPGISEAHVLLPGVELQGPSSRHLGVVPW